MKIRRNLNIKHGKVAPMSKLFPKTLAFALFAIFMVNMVAWSFNSHRLAHEIEHSREFAEMTLSLEPGENLNNDLVDSGADDAPSATEHQLLHAIDHLQFFPGIVFYGAIPFLPSTALFDFMLLTLPHAAFDPPFRPPRSISFLV